MSKLTLHQSYSDFFASSLHADCTILLDGQTLPAHKVILCGASSWFRGKFNLNPSATTIDLRKEPYTTEQLSIVIRSMYGHLELPAYDPASQRSFYGYLHDLSPLIILADYFDLKGYEEAFAELATKHSEFLFFYGDHPSLQFYREYYSIRQRSSSSYCSLEQAVAFAVGQRSSELAEISTASMTYLFEEAKIPIHRRRKPRTKVHQLILRLYRDWQVATGKTISFDSTKFDYTTFEEWLSYRPSLVSRTMDCFSLAWLKPEVKLVDLTASELITLELSFPEVQVRHFTSDSTISLTALGMLRLTLLPAKYFLDEAIPSRLQPLHPRFLTEYQLDSEVDLESWLTEHVEAATPYVAICIRYLNKAL